MNGHVIAFGFKSLTVERGENRRLSEVLSTNLYLRSITKGEIKLPMEEKVKAKVKKIRKNI